jgi:hypothetical protein
MIKYTELKRDRRKFLALTGLTLKEFQVLLPAFVEAYARKYPHDRTLAGQKRRRQRAVVGVVVCWTRQNRNYYSS